MRNNFKTVVIVLFLMLGITAFAQQATPKWTTVFDATPATMKSQLVSSSDESIKVRLQVPGFYTTTVSTPQGEAQIISVPKALSTAQAGEPNVPMIGIPVLIGDQARMNIRVVEAKYKDFDNIVVAPSKGDFPRTVSPASVPYTYGKCYSEDAFFPAVTAELYEPYILRDYRGQNMAVHPFVYNPVTKTLRVYYDMTVEMYKVDDKGQNVLKNGRGLMVKTAPDFKNVYSRHFINYEASQSKYTPVDEEGDLLIICHDSFISAMTPFVNWKKTRGVNTTIVGTSTAGSTSTAIKAFIQNRYNANNNLTHVLLVGDVAQIPGYTYSGATGYEGKGDNPYGQVVGNDIYNDLFIGRFSATTAAQVTNQVNKVITYERDLTTSDSWCQNGLGISTSEGSGGGHYNEDDYEHIENLRTDLLGYGYSTVYQDYYSVSGYPSSTTTTISNHINSGVGVINYCNHGSETAWQSHNYNTSHVNALTNSNKLPFIFSVACLVGKYDHTSDCFAEAWMRATNNSTGAPTGAIGGMFSYISQPWVPPMWAQDEFVDILTGQKNNNIKHTLGGTAVNGIISIFDHYSTSTAQAVGTYQAWVLYGDPTLMLRTKTPQAMTVTHEGIIIPGATSYTVSAGNANGAVATITDANHNILGKATVTNGTATISLNGTLTVGTDLTLCVFGYNKVTYTSSITVISPEGPYLSLDGYTPDTALVGEDTDLSLTLKNVGSADATGITTVILTSADSHVTIVSGTCYIDGLAVNDYATLSGFKFRFNAGVALGSPVILHYTAVNGSDNTWEGDIAVIPNQIFTVGVAPNNANYGTVSGGGQYSYNSSCTVTATPADGYMFTNWTKNGTVVSTDAAYTFNVTNDVNLVANFASGVMISGSTTTKSEYLPCYSYYKYSLTEQIYTSAELGGAGLITSIAFYNEGSTQTRNLDFYLKSTTKSSFTSGSNWIAVSASDKVFSGSVTMTANEWTTITFTTPFLYDGNSNVVLAVDDNTGSYVTSNQMACRVFNTTGTQAIYVYSDNTNYNPSSSSLGSGYTATAKNQLIVTKASAEPSTITLSANPAEAGTVTGGGVYEFGETCTVTATANPGYFFTGWMENGEVVATTLEYCFKVSADRELVATFQEGFMIGDGGTAMNNNLPSYSGKEYAMTQQIYTAAEIGTAGTITAIAFYNTGAVTARSYDMYLVHTDKTSFSSAKDWITVSADDKVFSGTVTMAKDTWTTFTLDIPFEYDGTSNLALVMDDNTGEKTSSSHLNFRVYATDIRQALYVQGSDTNFDPQNPPTESYAANLNNTLKKKNQLLLTITPTLALADNGSNNSAAINAAAGRKCNVTLAGRMLSKSGEWNTLCLPFDLELEGSILEGAIVKTLNDCRVDATKVTLRFSEEPLTKLDAGMPYIVKWENAEGTIMNPVFQGVTINATTEHRVMTDIVDFVGYYDALSLDPKGSDDFTASEVPNIYYMTTGSVLKHTGVARTLNACRAYFQFKPVTASRQLVLDFGGRDVVTGISLTPDFTSTGEGSWYTVDGMKLDQQPTRKGVYIQNGKKVVIK